MTLKEEGPSPVNAGYEMVIPRWTRNFQRSAEGDGPLVSDFEEARTRGSSRELIGGATTIAFEGL